MTPFVIRNAVLDDITSMYRISLAAHRRSYDTLIPESHRKAFVDCYTNTSQRYDRYDAIMKARLNSEDWRAWVAEWDGRVVGYTIVCKEEKALRGKGLFVDPDYQGRGVGRALFGHSVDAARGRDGMFLTVVAANKPARCLYDSYNFRVIGQADTYFFGAPQLVMYRSNLE